MDFPKVNTAVFHPICSSVMWSGDSPKKGGVQCTYPLVWVDHGDLFDQLNMLQVKIFCVSWGGVIRSITASVGPLILEKTLWGAQATHRSHVWVTAQVELPVNSWHQLPALWVRQPWMSSLVKSSDDYSLSQDWLQKFWASCSKSIKRFKTATAGLKLTVRFF